MKPEQDPPTPLPGSYATAPSTPPPLASAVKAEQVAPSVAAPANPARTTILAQGEEDKDEDEEITFAPGLRAFPAPAVPSKETPPVQVESEDVEEIVIKPSLRPTRPPALVAAAITRPSQAKQSNKALSDRAREANAIAQMNFHLARHSLHQVSQLY